MSQASTVIANGTGAAVRSAVNGGLATLLTNNSGTAAPASPVAGQFWADFTANVLKQRNADNSGWNTLFSLTSDFVPPPGFKNKIINGGFAVNQRVYVSGAAVGAGLYGHDRWKMAASGDTYTFATTSNKTTATIPAGKVLRQVVEGLNLQTGTYCLSWEGTAQGKIGVGSLSASGVTGLITGGTDTTIEFGPGTVANVQLELGTVATLFEDRPYSVELDLCQRYFCINNGEYNGICISGSVALITENFLCKMRVAPTMGAVLGVGGNLVSSAGGTLLVLSIANPQITNRGCYFQAVVASGLTTGDATFLTASSIPFSAEL